MAIKEIFEGHTDRINHATELLKVLGDREGQFVWKQLTAEGRDFVAFVTADDENSYPNGGMQDGYWYELVKEGKSGIDYGTVTVTGYGAVTVSHSLGVTPSHVYLIPLDNFTIDTSWIETYAVYDNLYFVAIYNSKAANGSLEKKSGARTSKTNTTITFFPEASLRKLTYIWFAVA